VFDFVVDKSDAFFHSVPDTVRATFCHWGTLLFDHESQTVTMDMVSCSAPLFLGIKLRLNHDEL